MIPNITSNTRFIELDFSNQYDKENWEKLNCISSNKNKNKKIRQNKQTIRQIEDWAHPWNMGGVSVPPQKKFERCIKVHFLNAWYNMLLSLEWFHQLLKKHFSLSLSLSLSFTHAVSIRNLKVSASKKSNLNVRKVLGTTKLVFARFLFTFSLSVSLSLFLLSPLYLGLIRPVEVV